MSDSNSTVEYRPVPNLPGYRVGSDGTVWSCFRGPLVTDSWRRLKPQRHRKGKEYLYLHLWDNGKRRTRLVHHLILESFVSPRPDGAETRHLDGDPTNNSLANLAWGPHAENTDDTRRLDRFDRKLTAEQVREIRARYAAGGVSQKDLAAEYGTTRMNVSSIINGASWRHLL
jgi:hypothetical protein